MVEEAFRALLHKVETQPCELQTLEIKAAHHSPSVACNNPASVGAMHSAVT